MKKLTKITVSLTLGIFSGASHGGSANVCWNHPVNNTDGTPIETSGPTSLVSSEVFYSLCESGNLSSNPLTETIPFPMSCATLEPLDPGDWCFGVKAQNEMGSISDMSNIASKNVPDVNLAPILEHPGKQTNYAGQTVSLQLNATDDPADVLTFSATGLPTGLSISNSGLISGTVTEIGNFYVNATVIDQGAASDTKGFGWDVLAIPVPQPPAVVTIDTVAYEFKPNGRVGKYVGSVELGVECGKLMKTTRRGVEWYDISIDKVNLIAMPRYAVVVAKCEAT